MVADCCERSDNCCNQERSEIWQVEETFSTPPLPAIIKDYYYQAEKWPSLLCNTVIFAL